MHEEIRETRANPLATTTTLVAVLAMVALAAPAPGEAASTLPTRGVAGETVTVREVAEAMARVARDLLERDQLHPGQTIAADPTVARRRVTPVTMPATEVRDLPPRLIVPERLLDLPPPVC